MTDLADLNDVDLAQETRRREIVLQEAIAEVSRRNTERGWPQWSEENCASVVARKRADHRHVERAETRTPNELVPPALFRLGYEWCALTIFNLLEQILDNPSSEITVTQSFEPVGKGLWKPVGPEKVSDQRRRAALDLILRMEAFYQERMRGMFFALPPRRSTYTEADDEGLKPDRIPQLPASRLMGR